MLTCATACLLQVLTIYFGRREYQWRFLDELLPFETNKLAKVEEGHAQVRRK